jgi:hypothetical protein
VSHLSDEFARLTPKLWSTLLAFAALSCPERSKSAAMPSDHCFGPDHDQRASPIGPESSQENPNGSIPVLQGRTLFPATQDLKLMAEGDILQDERTAGSKCGGKQVQDEI